MRNNKIWRYYKLKKFIERTLICSVLSTFILMPAAFADSIDVAIGQSQQVNRSSDQHISYHTVKDYESLRNAIENAKSGDVIIDVGDYDIYGNTLTICNKELTMVSVNRSRCIQLNCINIENGTLNLGIAGTEKPSELRVCSKFVLNNSTLNLYDGACISDFKRSSDSLIDAKNTDSKINLYGGSIQNNTFKKLIENGKEVSLTINGTVLLITPYVSGSLFTVKNFILKSGSITKSDWDYIIMAENATISGGTTNIKIQVTKNATVSGNASIDNLSCDSATILGGNIKNLQANKTLISGKATINKLVSEKITVDDTPSYKYEFIDNGTGIKVESDENITLCNIKHTTAPNVATFTISQPNDTDKDSIHHLNFYVNGKLAKSSDINKVAIYIPYTASSLDLNKLNSLRIYDSNNEEMTNCKKTMKAIDGKLYTLITIDNK